MVFMLAKPENEAVDAYVLVSCRVSEVMVLAPCMRRGREDMAYQSCVTVKVSAMKWCHSPILTTVM